LLILPSFVLTSVMMRSPVLLASALVGTTGAAIVDTAMRFGCLPSVPTWAVGMVFSPLLADSARTKPGDLQGLFFLACALASAPAVVFLCLFVLAGPSFLTVMLGSDYVSAYHPIILLTVAMTVNAMAGLSGNLCWMTGHERLGLKYNMAGVVALIGCAVTLSYSIGVVGICLSVLLAVGIRDYGMMFSMRKVLAFQTVFPSVRSFNITVELLKSRFLAAKG
jgi:O-antigen/teichoic acid export membrane protein